MNKKKQALSCEKALLSIFQENFQVQNRFEVEKLTNIEDNDLINHIYFILDLVKADLPFSAQSISEGKHLTLTSNLDENLLNLKNLKSILNKIPVNSGLEKPKVFLCDCKYAYMSSADGSNLNSSFMVDPNRENCLKCGKPLNSQDNTRISEQELDILITKIQTTPLPYQQQSPTQVEKIANLSIYGQGSFRVIHLIEHVFLYHCAYELSLEDPISAIVGLKGKLLANFLKNSIKRDIKFLIELVGDAEMTYELLHNLLMIMMENH